MAILFGLYTLGSITSIILLILLACITYHPLKRYIHKWSVMRPIPGMEGAFPIIGNALQFKANAAGKVLWPSVCLTKDIWMHHEWQRRDALRFIFVCFFSRLFQTDNWGHWWEQEQAFSQGLGGTCPLPCLISRRDHWGVYYSSPAALDNMMHWITFELYKSSKYL